MVHCVDRSLSRGSFSTSSTTTTPGRKARRDRLLGYSTGGPVQPDLTISPRTGEQKSEKARDSRPGASYREVGRMEGQFDRVRSALCPPRWRPDHESLQFNRRST